jgi:hypothetical protein
MRKIQIARRVDKNTKLKIKAFMDQLEKSSANVFDTG